MKAIIRTDTWLTRIAATVMARRDRRRGRFVVDPVTWKDYRDEVATLQGGSMDGLENEEPYYTPEEEAEIESCARSQGW